MALRIMKKIVIWSIRMKILERRDPKKNKNEEKLSLYLFWAQVILQQKFPIRKRKICELLTTCFHEKPNFKFRIFTHFLTNKIVLMKQQQKQIAWFDYSEFGIGFS